MPWCWARSDGASALRLFIEIQEQHIGKCPGAPKLGRPRGWGVFQRGSAAPSRGGGCGCSCNRTTAVLNRQRGSLPNAGALSSTRTQKSEKTLQPTGYAKARVGPGVDSRVVLQGAARGVGWRKHVLRVIWRHQEGDRVLHLHPAHSKRRCVRRWGCSALVTRKQQQQSGNGSGSLRPLCRSGAGKGDWRTRCPATAHILCGLGRWLAGRGLRKEIA